MNPVVRLPFYFSFIFYDDLIIIASDTFRLSSNNLYNLLVRKHETGRSCQLNPKRSIYAIKYCTCPVISGRNPKSL